MGVSTARTTTTPVLAVPPAEAARLLSLSPQMIYKLIRLGRLRTVSIGRTTRALIELERLLNINDHGAAGPDHGPTS